MKRVALFDFHNTLVTCDRWLELEIKALPGLVLQRLAEGDDVTDLPLRSAEATDLFRQLRDRVKASGHEISAADGTLEVLHSMGYSFSEVEVERAVAELEQACLPEIEIVPGADHTLQRLHDRGLVLGVVSSSGYPPFVELALEELGLRTYFSEVLTSAGEGLYKSNPEIFRRAVTRLGATPSESVHIGDHAQYDVRSAKQAGLSAIWFMPYARRTANQHNASWAELEREGAQADAMASSMEEVYEAVIQLA